MATTFAELFAQLDTADIPDLPEGKSAIVGVFVIPFDVVGGDTTTIDLAQLDADTAAFFTGADGVVGADAASVAVRTDLHIEFDDVTDATAADLTTPLDPGTPTGDPGAPVDPTAPVDPAPVVDPGAPVPPVDPTVASDPTDGTSPDGGTPAGDPTDPGTPVDPTVPDPTAPVAPTAGDGPVPDGEHAWDAPR